jgi:hypothetical protein
MFQYRGRLAETPDGLQRRDHGPTSCCDGSLTCIAHAGPAGDPAPKEGVMAKSKKSSKKNKKNKKKGK